MHTVYKLMVVFRGRFIFKGAKNITSIYTFLFINLIKNFMFEFQCIITLYYIKNQLDATLAVLFISYCKITLHAPVAASTVVSTPDDGRRKRPKHVE